jgi:hypothetical protein
MGKATNRKTKPKADNRIPPTVEQMARGEFHSQGMAYKRVAVIDTMLTRGQLTDKEYLVLSYYRDQANLADRSPLKSCIDFSVTGGDSEPSAALTSALLETARMERDMGSVWPIARAVAVDDQSLTEWCINQHGGRERYDSAGRFVAIVPVREKSVIGIALLELKMAARRITK